MAIRLFHKLALAVLLLASSAVAGRAEVEARRPLDLDRFMGRWYEILRTPNDAQKNCHAAFQVWSQPAPGKFSIAQVCHRDSAIGPEHRVQTGARVLNPPTNTQFEASFFGGLFHRDYTVLDHADDYAWMIAATSNGKYVAVLARRPTLSRTDVDKLKGEVAAMGLAAQALVLVSEN